MANSGVLSFVPAPEPAIAEMARILRPGGTLPAYLWDYTQGGMELIRYFWEPQSPWTRAVGSWTSSCERPAWRT
ncbi:methyltransferase domain-containing protein [Streptomyces sp. A1547]